MTGIYNGVIRVLVVGTIIWAESRFGTNESVNNYIRGRNYKTPP